MTYEEELNDLLLRCPVTQQEAFAFFDKLPVASPSMFSGTWKGSELPAGHPMDGVLGAVHWYGKMFRSKDKVYPLLFERRGGKLFAGNPALMPLRMGEKLPRPLIRVIFKILSPFLKTKEYGAVLREMSYRGKHTAAMIYDRQPVIDYFGRVNEYMVLGVTETRWDASQGCFFILEKVNGRL